jgi:hypothetical protein
MYGLLHVPDRIASSTPKSRVGRLTAIREMRFEVRVGDERADRAMALSRRARVASRRTQSRRLDRGQRTARSISSRARQSVEKAQSSQSSSRTWSSRSRPNRDHRSDVNDSR